MSGLGLSGSLYLINAVTARPGVFECRTAAYCLLMVGWGVIDISVPLKRCGLSRVQISVVVVVATLLLCSRGTGEGFSWVARGGQLWACTRALC